MTLDVFRSTLSSTDPPDALSPALQAMWQEARGNWEAAHAIAQGIDDKSGAWVHAYLHRKEGDGSNAAYWYRRAGQPVAADRFEEEWARIVSALLA
jgi:hypothetical protein